VLKEEVPTRRKKDSLAGHVLKYRHHIQTLYGDGRKRRGAGNTGKPAGDTQNNVKIGKRKSPE